jgi:DNA-binding NarL/FixJ family response regulator
MNDTIHVFLVDDCPTVCAGLRKVLEPPSDVNVLGEANDGETALELIESLQPDVVLLDCQMPGMTGMQFAATMQKKRLPTNVLAFSVHYDDDTVRGMLNAGAVGYLLKDEPPERIIEAIRAVAQGDGWFSQNIAAQMATWVRIDQSDSPELTGRELDVLLLLTKGKTNDCIADELKISERTVRFHLRNVYDKIGAHSRTEAVLWAVQHHLNDK